MSTRLSSIRTLLWAGLLALPAAATLAADSATQTFVTEAAQGGIAEVTLGKLAADQGANEEVRKFGRQMVVDHEAANTQLIALAKRKGLSLPTAPDQEHQRLAQKLKAARGDEFDQQYLNSQLADHEKMSLLMARYAESGTDPQLKAFAAESGKVVEAHLDMVKRMLHAGIKPGDGPSGDVHEMHRKQSTRSDTTLQENPR